MAPSPRNGRLSPRGTLKKTPTAMALERKERLLLVVFISGLQETRADGERKEREKKNKMLGRREQVASMVSFGEGPTQRYAVHFEDGWLAVLQDRANGDSGFVEYAGAYVCESPVTCVDVCPTAPRLVAGLKKCAFLRPCCRRLHRCVWPALAHVRTRTRTHTHTNTPAQWLALCF